MAELNDVYGQNYQTESQQSKNNYLLNIITNNIAHRQFHFTLSDASDLWGTSNELSPQNVDTIIHKVNNINKHIHMYYMDKTKECINMLPELIIDTQVIYFMIIDAEYHKAYYIYITPREVNAF